MGSFTDTDNDTDDFNGEENLNLINLIKHDLEEDETSDNSDVVIYRDKSEKAKLPSEGPDSNREENCDGRTNNVANQDQNMNNNLDFENTLRREESGEMCRNERNIDNIENDNQANKDIYSSTITENESPTIKHTGNILQELLDVSDNRMLNHQDNEVEDDEIDSSVSNIDSSSVEVDSEDPVDVNETLDDGSDVDNPRIDVPTDSDNTSTTTGSASSDDDFVFIKDKTTGRDDIADTPQTLPNINNMAAKGSITFYYKAKKLSNHLREANLKLEEEMKKSKILRLRLHNERIEKEKMECSLSDLQGKYDTKLKEEEELVQHFDLIFEEDTIGNPGVKDSSSHGCEGGTRSMMVQEETDKYDKQSRVNNSVAEMDELKKFEEKENNNSKYMEEASTLEQVQDAHGKMRDNVLEDYNKEVASLKDRLRIAEENTNEEITINLHQELSDARLEHEHFRISYEEEKEIQRKKFVESEAKQNQLVSDIHQMKLDVEMKTEQYKSTQVSLQKTQKISDERKEKTNELTTTLTHLNSNMEAMKASALQKDELILQMKAQIAWKEEILAKDRREKERLQTKVDVMESVKLQHRRLEEEAEEIGHKAKLRGEKVKFLKKHIREIEQQKQNAENLTLVIPEMQKTIDELNGMIVQMKRDVIDKQRQEGEKKRKKEEERREEEVRLEKERKAWERRVLGIGRCPLGHETDTTTNAILARSNSVSLFKPRPPSAKHQPCKNGSKQNTLFVQTLNSSTHHSFSAPIAKSYPESIKITQKTNQHEEKIILSRVENRSKSSVVRRHTSKENTTYKQITHGKSITNNSNKSPCGHAFIPRVLEWGDQGPIDKALAVGNHVMANIHIECITHGDTTKQQRGVVKFIGFVEGNDDEVYIGLRLEESVGCTDGWVQGKRYFRSERSKGVFVRLYDIAKFS